MTGTRTVAVMVTLVVCLAASGCSTPSQAPPAAAPGASAQTSVTPAEARTIARDAYVYGYPMVDSYRIQHAYFVDPKNPEYKAPWNQIRNIPRVFTPEDKAVQTPNSDTPYSMAGLGRPHPSTRSPETPCSDEV